MEKKICKKCGEEKDLNEFRYRTDTNKHEATCKKCKRENKKLYSLVCKHCGKEFKSDRKKQQFCSHKCNGQHRSKKEIFICENCGNEFTRNPSQFNGTHKYCSYRCANEGFSKFYSGENAPNYNPNLSEEERAENRRIEGYNKWLNDVYKRDSYTCQCCGDNKGGNLNAHHLYNYSEYKDKRLDVENGITLCKECHMKFHKKYGYKHNNPEQIKEFLKEENIIEHDNSEIIGEIKEPPTL